MSDAENPKLSLSGIVDALPQTGDCPMGCRDGPCFYNDDNAWYRTKAYSLFPHPDWVGDRIVRVNSGHDSGLGGVVRLPAGHWLLPDLGVAADEGVWLKRDTLVAMCRYYYPKCFWNTSIPDFRFPGPVVFTCNGRIPLVQRCPPNVAAVRIRYNSWGWTDLAALARWYDAENVPILLTSMRYSEESSIPPGHRADYVFKTHVANPYWTLRPVLQFQLLRAVQGVCDHVGIVHHCGTEKSSLCRDCGNCAKLYAQCVERMKEDKE